MYTQNTYLFIYIHTHKNFIQTVSGQPTSQLSTHRNTRKWGWECSETH